MEKLRFEEPVYLAAGIGIPVEICSVERAYALLNDWPVWRRDAAHITAHNACKAALSGAIDVETTRAALAVFATRTYGSFDIAPLPPSSNLVHLGDRRPRLHQ